MRRPGDGRPPDRPGALTDRAFLLASAAVVGAGLGLRLYGLGTQEFWFDELISLRFAVSSAWDWPRSLANDTPPLYYLLLRASLRLLGQSEAAVRALSASLGTGFVALTIWAARTFFDRRVALWSGLVAALNPIHVYYSQEARAYALLVLVLLAAYAALWRALETDTASRWTAFAALVATALYSHYLAIVGLVPALVLPAMWPERAGRTRRLRRAACALGVGLLLFLPWAAGRFLVTGYRAARHAWVTGALEVTGRWVAIPRSLEVFALGSQAGFLPSTLKQYDVLTFPLGLRLAGLAGVMLLAALFASPVGDRETGIPWLVRRKAWVATLVLGPLMVLWLLSFVVPVYLVGRYDMVAFPAFPIVLGVALGKAWALRRSLAVALAGLLLMPTGAKLYTYHTEPAVGSGRVIAELLDTTTPNETIVLLATREARAIVHYLGRRGYRREGDTCVAPTSSRRFVCLLPGGDVPTPLRVGDALARARALEARAGLWLAVDMTLHEGRVMIAEPMRELLVELERLGFHPARFTALPSGARRVGLVEFRVT